MKRTIAVLLSVIFLATSLSLSTYSDELPEGGNAASQGELTPEQAAQLQAQLTPEQLAQIQAEQIKAEMDAVVASHKEYVASHPNMTPEEYLILMNSNPYFNIKAYMYYNEDLMSRYTYNYWQYYQQYLNRGYKEKRSCLFPPEDDYNKGTLGRYSTKYNYKIARGDNLTLACDFMNGTIVQPGGLFSYNAAVGQRTSASGFKIAHVYSGGQVVDGIGGGICQISSTLYVAMMIAGIPATEHHFHSLPVSYLKPNLDATVSWDKLDLTFINPYNFPIMILAQAKEGTATISICKAPAGN